MNTSNINGSVNSSNFSDLYFTAPFRIVGSVVSMFLLLVGVVGNVLVIIVIILSRKLHTSTNCFLISLSLADLIVLLSATAFLPLELFSMKYNFVLGRVMCSILVFLQYLGVNVSSLSISILSYERWIAICHPMKSIILRQSIPRAIKRVFTLWIFSILYNSIWLYLTVYKKKTLPGDIVVHQCTFRLARKYYLAIYMFDFVDFYCLPIILSAVFHLQMAKSMERSFQLQLCSNVAFRGELINAQGFFKERKQIIRMLIVVVVLFAFFWMPYRAWVVYNSFSSRPFLNVWFMLFARCMGYANSAINPIIYNLMSTKFNTAFRQILSCYNVIGTRRRYNITGTNTASTSRDIKMKTFPSTNQEHKRN